MGAGSAAVYFDIDCCAWRDVAHAFGLFQTYALILGRGFDCAHGLGGETYAHSRR